MNDERAYELAGRRGAIKRIHVNQQLIRQRTKDKDAGPCLTVQTSAGPIRAYRVDIRGPSSLVESVDKPLGCGARVWIETRAALSLVTEPPEPTAREDLACALGDEPAAPREGEPVRCEGSGFYLSVAITPQFRKAPSARTEECRFCQERVVARYARSTRNRHMYQVITHYKEARP